MSAVRLKVGASLDASALKVFEPLEKAAERAAKNIRKSLNSGGDGAVRAARETSRKVLTEEEKAERDRTKAAETWAKKRAQIQRNSSAMAGKEAARAADEEIRQAKRAAVEQGRAAAARGRAANKAADDEIRAAERAGAAAERASSKAARLAARAAGAAARASERARDKEQGSSWWKRGGSIGFGHRSAVSVSRGAALAYGMTGSAIGSGVGLAESLIGGMGVDLSVASHMANAQETQQRIADVTNAGYIPGAKGAQGALQDQGAVRKDVYGAADAGRFSIGDTAEGLQKFVGLTGDLETGRAILKETAILARATGSDFGVMAEASAEVSNHLGNIPNKANAVEKVMRVVAGQGKRGALEIKDFARQMAKIAANAPMFEGKVEDTIGDLALIAQESKMGGGAASASQAATSVLAFASDFSKKTTFKHWQEANVYNPATHRMEGLNPFTDNSHTKLRSPQELIMEALNYSKGDQLKLANLFPSRMAQRAVKPFASIYAEAHGTDEQKMAAVVAEFDRLRAAQLNAEEIQRAYTEAIGTSKSAAQLANNKLDEMAASIQSALIPALAGFAPALEKLVPKVEEFANSLANLINMVSGADQKNAEDAAGAVDGKLSGDEKLLYGSRGSQFVPGHGMVPTYSGEAIDIIRAHGTKRSSSNAQLMTAIEQKEKDAKWLETEDKMDIGGVQAKLAHAMGGESVGEKAAADRAEAARMREELAKGTAEATQSNELLRRIMTAVETKDAVIIRAAPTVAPGATAPAESEGP